jgi:membrane protease YdiL (CAAX protease family)
METTPPSSWHFAVWAAVFEGGMAVVAVPLGWLFSEPPLETFAWSWAALGWGLAGIVPPLGLFWFCLVCPWRPFRHLVSVVEEHLLPLFRTLGLLEIAVICLLAGLGEEMLFRGVVQAGLADLATGWLGRTPALWLGLLLAGALFGLAHAITLTYLVLAALIGVYLGGLWLLSGNLLAPIAAHAGYDFLALVYLARLRRTEEA